MPPCGPRGRRSPPRTAPGGEPVATHARPLRHRLRLLTGLVTSGKSSTLEYPAPFDAAPPAGGADPPGCLGWRHARGPRAAHPRRGVRGADTSGNGCRTTRPGPPRRHLARPAVPRHGSLGSRAAAQHRCPGTQSTRGLCRTSPSPSARVPARVAPPLAARRRRLAAPCTCFVVGLTMPAVCRLDARCRSSTSSRSSPASPGRATGGDDRGRRRRRAAHVRLAHLAVRRRQSASRRR